MTEPCAATDFVIVGAGPAGLAAADDLARRGIPSVVLERDDCVGGLSRTVEHEGCRFDIGGHRFFTKSDAVAALWHDLLPDDFLRRPRLSRIYYRRRFFRYPLRPMNALLGLGFLRSAHVLASFLWRKMFPRRPERSFEDWVSNRFGTALYEIFFRTYTEKVWGIPCGELSADWAAQRIRNLSLGSALAKALGFGRRKRDVASLIEEFDYPKLGPGQMYESLAKRASARGSRILLEHRVTRITHRDGEVRTVAGVAPEGPFEIDARRVISTMPLSELVLALDPPAPAEVVDAARALRYRSILTVNFILDVPEVLPDTWVYLHAPEVKAGRLQLYKNWSPFMVPEAGRSTVGLEYFSFEDDDLWNADPARLIDMARADLETLDLVDASHIVDAVVLRYAKAYPIYDREYQQHVCTIRRHLDTLANLECAGRYGQFRYNNMDHSIMTALLAVRRLLGEPVDPWAVNSDAEYHEEDAGERATTPSKTV